MDGHPHGIAARRTVARPGDGGIPTSDGSVNTLQSQQQFLISPTEAIYGLGEDAAGLMNYRGATVHLQNQNPSECGLPVLVSSRGYGVFWDNPAISDVNVAESSGANLTWSSDAAGSIDYYFMYGPALDNVVADYRSLTGNPPMFGKWAWGFWQCKEHYADSAGILQVANLVSRAPCPVGLRHSGLVLLGAATPGVHTSSIQTVIRTLPQMMNQLHAENTALDYFGLGTI